MLYHLLKIIVGALLRIFCRKIVVNKPGILKIKGPVLLACNHPNSLLDAIIIDVLFQQPVHSLARGDVFKNKFVAPILSSLKMLPVYRVSEGVENLSTNYTTFEACKEIFREKGIVQIFSEGKCINEWRLRPLKKGTARLAISSCEEDIPLQVIPVGINYSSFRRFGKNVFINFGEAITKDQLENEVTDGLKYQAFNNELQNQLSGLVYDIDKHDISSKQQKLAYTPPSWKKTLLFFPSLIGAMVHGIFYWPVKQFALRVAGHNDHFDSVMMVLMVFLYPLFILTLVGFSLFAGYAWIALLLLALLPFTAWAHVQLKPQLDKLPRR